MKNFLILLKRHSLFDEKVHNTIYLTKYLRSEKGSDIMKNKKILILDDTLSAVDNIVASKIKESLKKEKATTIIISHNLLNVKHADKIIVLEDGKISAMGTHDELVQKEGFYSNVWNIQQMIEEVQE